MRETLDLAVWDLAGIPIVVGNLGALQNAGISPLWRSPLGPLPPDPTCSAPAPRWEWLLDKAYAAKRRALIDPARAALDPTYGAPATSCGTVRHGP